MHEIYLSESKSMANRLLIISSFNKNEWPSFRSEADDIVELKKSLIGLGKGDKEFTIGEGGTTFRFLLTRLSREKGKFIVNAKPQLLRRPQQELYRLLEKLGSKITANDDSVIIDTNGWGEIDEISIDCEKSTQFASAIMLSSFLLEHDMKLKLINFDKSITYLNMTTDILRAAGMKILETDGGICILKNSQVEKLPLAEPDMSSAFSIASMGVVGPAKILYKMPRFSLQGDAVFIDILERMNIDIERVNQTEDSFDLIVRPSVNSLKPINIDLAQCPDLLPVLSSLCALCSGTSKITGIGHTRFKESDRIAKSEELVVKSGAIAKSTQDSLEITGPLKNYSNIKFSFDPANDHRMAMAAAVLKGYGISIEIQSPNVVNKSYPNFWEDAFKN